MYVVSYGYSIKIGNYLFVLGAKLDKRYINALRATHELAGGQGLEPRYSAPKTEVLPLDDPPIRIIYTIYPTRNLPLEICGFPYPNSY